jgi:hypothetical protein
MVLRRGVKEEDFDYRQLTWYINRLKNLEHEDFVRINRLVKILNYKYPKKSEIYCYRPKPEEKKHYYTNDSNAGEPKNKFIFKHIIEDHQSNCERSHCNICYYNDIIKVNWDFFFGYYFCEVILNDIRVVFSADKTTITYLNILLNNYFYLSSYLNLKKSNITKKESGFSFYLHFSPFFNEFSTFEHIKDFIYPHIAFRAIYQNHSYKTIRIKLRSYHIDDLSQFKKSLRFFFYIPSKIPFKEDYTYNKALITTNSSQLQKRVNLIRKNNIKAYIDLQNNLPDNLEYLEYLENEKEQEAALKKKEKDLKDILLRQKAERQFFEDLNYINKLIRGLIKQKYLKWSTEHIVLIKSDNMYLKYRNYRSNKAKSLTFFEIEQKHANKINKITRDSMFKREQKELIDSNNRKIRDEALRAKGMKTTSDYIKMVELETANDKDEK